MLPHVFKREYFFQITIEFCVHSMQEKTVIVFFNKSDNRV